MYIFVHKYLFSSLIISLGCIPRNGNSGSNAVRMWRLLRNLAQIFCRKMVAIYVPISNVRVLCLVAFWQALDNMTIIIILILFNLFHRNKSVIKSSCFLVKCYYIFPPSFLFSSCCPTPGSQFFSYIHIRQNLSLKFSTPHPHLTHAAVNFRLQFSLF